MLCCDYSCHYVPNIIVSDSIASRCLCDWTRLVSVLGLFNDSLSMTFVTASKKNDMIMNNEFGTMWTIVVVIVFVGILV
jgi:hypothetical protein